MRPPESFVDQPVRSLQTMLRVLALDDASRPSVVPDGVYGPVTMTAVAAFQRQNGLPVTGVTDDKTWNRIEAVYETAVVRIRQAQPIEILMEPGSSYTAGFTGPYVFLAQSMLTQLSLYHPVISPPGHTGIMDEATCASVAAFQQLAGLPGTGSLDRITWKHLVLQFTLCAHHCHRCEGRANKT